MNMCDKLNSYFFTDTPAPTRTLYFDYLTLPPRRQAIRDEALRRLRRQIKAKQKPPPTARKPEVFIDGEPGA